jgi:hypothetical protein
MIMWGYTKRHLILAFQMESKFVLERMKERGINVPTSQNMVQIKSELSAHFPVFYIKLINE